MDFEIILFISFIVLLSLILYIKREKLIVQKIAFPLFYLIMYRSNAGIDLMDRIAKKYKSAVQLFGYCCVGLGFVGLVYVSFSILLFFIRLIIKPQAQEAGVSLVLPFTNIPGIGYLSFSHWIISIFILAVIHEFAHGVVARAHNLEVKSSGFAVFAILFPIIPAAFVEPDEKKMAKEKDIVQYSILAAGPMVNILLAFILVLAFPFVADQSNTVLAPFEEKITEPIGFSYETLENETYPAYDANLPSGTIQEVNGILIENYADFHSAMTCVMPNSTVTLKTTNETYTITTIANPDDSSKGFLGIRPTQNERRIKAGYETIAPAYYWFKGLIKWLFLLNFFIGLANLLPLGIVDGGRMLQVALHSVMSDKKKAQKIWIGIAFLFLGALLFALFVNYFGNPFLLFK